MTMAKAMCEHKHPSATGTEALPTLTRMTEDEAREAGRRAGDVWLEKHYALGLREHPMSSSYQAAKSFSMFMGGVECAHDGCDDGGDLQAEYAMGFVEALSRYALTG